MIRRAFTAVELVIVLVVLVTIVAVLAPVASRSRNAAGLEMSLMNIRTIVAANTAYTIDTTWPAMRGASYTNGSMNGWDSWCYGGKNASVYWQTSFSGLFDESAYSRPLNGYLYGGRIPVPSGYLNTGSGASWPGQPGNWNFRHGTPTAAQRLLQIPVFKSPGDVATIQRNWPNPTPGVTCYDDVGTSYMLNMKWWDAPGQIGTFTQRYTVGCQRIAAATVSPNYVFIHDQTADRVANGIATVGEFGKQNASAVGYIDGRAAYIAITPSATSGPGYTFIP
ncbi:MAG: hypothetical protein ACKVW3_16525 [Phycisphaerales bacterium]